MRGMCGRGGRGRWQMGRCRLHSQMGLFGADGRRPVRCRAERAHLVAFKDCNVDFFRGMDSSHNTVQEGRG